MAKTPPPAPEVAKARARVAGLASHGADPKRVEQARADLAAARAAANLEDHVRAVVDAAPTLSPEQREQLALLLAPDQQSAAGERAAAS